MTRVLPRKVYTLTYVVLWVPAVVALVRGPIWLYFALALAPVLFSVWWSPDRRWNLPRRKPAATPTVAPVPCDCPGCCRPATEVATTVAPCCGEDAAPGCCEPVIFLRKNDNPA